MKRSYYLIRQVLPYIEPNIIKIYEPTNIVHIKQLIETMIGQLYVYHYNGENNSRKDLTDELGNTNFNIFDYPFEKISVRKHLYKLSGTYPVYIKTYGIYARLRDVKIPSKFYMNGFVYFHGGTSFDDPVNSSLFFCDLDSNKSNKISGEDYERFIAEKYEKSGYKVTLNGIEKSYEDGGIDLIVENNTSIILVQCKNWSLSNKYKIDQKDIRAFIGDCYLFARENIKASKKVGFHFIVSHEDFLTSSAKIFLQQHPFIKFKSIPFEEIDNQNQTQ